MGRRRSRSKKSSNAELASESTSLTEARRKTARELRTLPSATSTQRLARTPSKITGLLDHAHQHVELAMRICDGENDSSAGGDDDWPSLATTQRTDSGLLFDSSSTLTSKARLVLRVLLRKKQRVVRLAGKAAADDARYNRLKQGFVALSQHLKDTDATRLALQDALGSFRKHAIAVESVLPPEPRDSRVMVTSLHACFAKSASLVDDLLATLSQTVAVQTLAKAEQLAAFKDTLERRERLFLDTVIAKQQLDQFLKLKAKQRSAIPGAYDLELAQRKHEHAESRRRLVSLTAAMEHVFQFHAHLDQCIVDPEMATAHEQLTRFFEKHARVFEKNVK